MKEFSSEFLRLKNLKEGTRAWTHLVEIQTSAASTARFCTSAETTTWNGNTYAPVAMRIGEEEVRSDMSMPRMSIDVANYGGQAYRFAKDNDLSLNNVTIRMVNLALTTSGNDARVTMQVLGCAFENDAARFELGLAFTHDMEGPRRTWNRRDFPEIPYNFDQWFISNNQ